MIKYYKFGFGRATDYINEEIRLDVSHEKGIEVVERYDDCCGPDYSQFLRLHRYQCGAVLASDYA